MEDILNNILLHYNVYMDHRSADSKVPNFITNFSILMVSVQQLSISSNCLLITEQILSFHPLY